MAEPGEGYILATDADARTRLRLLHRIYGPSTSALLDAVGIVPGMRAVDIGCGIGLVTTELARRVGAAGSTTGVDMSPDHLADARRRADETGVAGVDWKRGRADATGLAHGMFDVAYCRFLLEHLADPAAAVREMHALLKPGGIVICEAIDVASLATHPPSEAYPRVVALLLRLQQGRGSDGTIGPKVHGLVRAAGFEGIAVRFDQPVFLAGEEKRFWEITFLETVPAMLRDGIVTSAEVAALRSDLARIAADPTTLVACARKVQTWARKPQ